MKLLGGIGLLVALCACAGQAARVGVGADMILPPMASAVKVRTDEQFLMASHLNPDRLPEYPAPSGWRDADSTRVCVEMVVDEHGGVARAEPLRGVPECPVAEDESLRPYEASALVAVREWQFLAAAICRFPPGLAPNADCAGEGVEERTVPIRIAFKFDFTRSGGRPRASIGRGS